MTETTQTYVSADLSYLSLVHYAMREINHPIFSMIWDNHGQSTPPLGRRGLCPWSTAANTFAQRAFLQKATRLGCTLKAKAPSLRRFLSTGA